MQLLGSLSLAGVGVKVTDDDEDEEEEDQEEKENVRQSEVEMEMEMDLRGPIRHMDVRCDGIVNVDSQVVGVSISVRVNAQRRKHSQRKMMMKRRTRIVYGSAGKAELEVDMKVDDVLG